MNIQIKIWKDVLYIKVDDSPWFAKYIKPELEANELSRKRPIGFKYFDDKKHK